MANKYIKYVSLTVTILAVAFVTIFTFAKNENNISDTKIIGSKSFDETAFRIKINSIDEILKFADLVAIGKVIDDGKTVETEFPLPGGESQAKKLKAMYPNINTKMEVTHTNVQIEKVIYGSSPTTDIITVGQMGQAGNDEGETKIKREQKVLLILKKHPGTDNLYSSVDAENGLFKIEKNSKVISFSDNEAVSKYDNNNVDILVNDITNGLKKQKK
ncbi:hypothetical protein [Pseudobacteroides cellulosolvens]|uniref:Uncharacterized protein n=1 Tax=Pseudobacteroides cellulosolvens ATCC 35603 = DSM 2933 TaxID=398512 RepID=A0A0L6JP69_9FIRM|nr:hypothetical protein [Pseudobacteroides cellulosolvens]KNY27578.1 hypothetical protein Bccel_2849 [Pseudobacteroides cellulosolvens ATCC 35603 = DSM 2933]